MKFDEIRFTAKRNLVVIEAYVLGCKQTSVVTCWTDHDLQTRETPEKQMALMKELFNNAFDLMLEAGAHE